MPVSPSRAAIAAALLLVPALAGGQQLLGRSESVFTWRGSLTAGGMLVVRNPNGPIEVRPSTGSAVEVRAEKRGGDASDVAFDVRSASNGDISVCAVFGDRNPCEDQNRWSNDDRGWRRQVTVSFVVLVPRSARLSMATGNGAITIERTGSSVQASTGNGRLRITGTEGTVRASTGNGDVDVREARSSVRVTTGNGNVTVSTAEGPVEARSGNGDVDVTIASLRARDNMTFSTGSGQVRLSIPAGFNGELDASTGNGEISSDFDLKLKGRLDPRRIRATIGDGGPTLRLSTGNGRLELRKSR